MRRIAFVLLLAAVLAPAAEATYPGEDGAIALNSYGSKQDILVMRPDGSEVRNLTRTCDRSERLVDWSPDGARLAFFAIGGPGGSSSGTLQTIAREGGETTTIASVRLETKPTWSPDASKLLFTARGPEDGFDDLFVVNADGSGRTNLTNTPDIAEQSPAWSPDGTSIVFAAGTNQGPNSVLYTMGAAGGERTQLTQPEGMGGSRDSYPDWSPDGSKIIFSRSTGDAVSGTSGIYTVPAAGGDLVPLIGPIPGFGLSRPSWSPSGTKFVYEGGVERQAFTANADGSGATRINGEFQSAPDWGSSQSYGGVAGGCESDGEGGQSPFGGHDVRRFGISWALRCTAPESVASACAARITLSTIPRPRRRGRSAGVVGSKSATIPAGASRNVVATLRPAAKRRLRRRGRLRLRARAVVSYGEGSQAHSDTDTRTITLRAQPPS